MWWKIEGQKQLFWNLNEVKKVIITEGKKVVILHFKSGEIEKVNPNENEYISLMKVITDKI